MKRFSFRRLIENWDYILSIPKTALFNFRYFPFAVAIRLPVFVCHRVLLKRLSGSVEIGRVKTGIVKIGFGDMPLFDCRRVRSVLFLSGRLVFQGVADIGPGCQIGVGGESSGAELVFGDGFGMTGFGMISTRSRISFGKNVIVSWNVTITDHDWHDIVDETGKILNAARPVTVGDDVWICLGALIMKGSTLKDGTIVAAGTTLATSVDAPNAIIGQDLRVRIIRENVHWMK